ncbi:NAD(P)-dependent dehydrogenase, short-chain alcohol dehydrogenase family [Flagellimonas taeanensis]|uniref:NAD(P)-dependent dehydrogenase, short-chain alcohol dehydrogenase family n=1 Tax=Flagellimonas taeanensis TaxID=1005926 RepID=A0A1M6PDI9_9FLAO|nr:SDR family oxidoreductase [Allomuricauda taeanensis]SFB66626.1 NAD(P)-dependent dehydrogenase, short-chain alcohol dehydrogenase family [Allomuricauda taeanensis]SHK05942.1 NAD(P)-dependent dehydrogenase, short-chain alcohol dehydrogenase family [Allomuricauda taeanensis]
MKLKDKVCIVTGATSGMGKAIAETLSSEGAKLVLSGQNRERGQNLEKQLGNSVFLAGDVTDPIYNQNLVQLAMDTFGQLDIISLNAGILGLGNVEELSIASWHKTIDTNLSSIFYLCKYGLPYLQKGSNSSILINASIAAFKSFPNHPAYCASKAGAIALMKQMAMEYAPKIRVNAICPGPVDTPLLWESAKAFENPEKAVANAEKATLLKRLGTPEDIAKLALFMVSDDSSWITGTTITIDGGIINT